MLKRQEGAFLSSGAYRPHRSLAPGEKASLSVGAHLPWNESGIYLEANAEYEFSATGQWRDGDSWSGPEGAHRRQLRHLPGTLLGKVEPLYQALTQNWSANFMFTRRLESAPWMSLVGVIANGKLSVKGEYLEHETFAIGARVRYRVLAPGYLYAFANDARGAYNDNLGNIELTICRVE